MRQLIKQAAQAHTQVSLDVEASVAMHVSQQASVSFVLESCMHASVNL